MFFKSLLSFLFIWPIFGFCDFNINGRIYSYNTRKVVLVGWMGSYNKILSSGVTDSHGVFNIRIGTEYIGKIYIKLDHDIVLHMISDGSNLTLLLDYYNPNKIYAFNSHTHEYADAIINLIKLNSLLDTSDIMCNNYVKNSNLLINNVSEKIINYNLKIDYLLHIVDKNIKYIQNNEINIKMINKLNYLLYKHPILLDLLGKYQDVKDLCSLLNHYKISTHEQDVKECGDIFYKAMISIENKN
jgi:hypothetical protein